MYGHRVKLAGDFAAGATVGGLIVGLTEGLYRGVGIVYPAVLYGAIWSIAGTLGALILGRFIWRRSQWLGVGLGTWGAVGAIALSALILVRFIVLRDVMHESPQAGPLSMAAGLIAGLTAAGLTWGIGLFMGMRKRRRDPDASFPGGWVWPPVVGLIFVVMTGGGDDPLPRFLPEAKPLKGQGVILVVVDTLRADALGVYGAPLHRQSAPTPHIDDFSRSAQTFRNVSAQASWTKPAVASIMSSRHAVAHQAMGKASVLPESLPTLATILSAQGIATAAVVTNYNLEQGYGFARGFDDFRYLPPGRYLGAPPRANRLAAYNVYRLLREKIFKNNRQSKHFYRNANTVNAIGLRILDKIAKNKDDRFFLWLHYMEPHDPYFSIEGQSFARVSDPHPKAQWSGVMREAYRDDVHRFDEGFGQLIDALGARGILDNATIILVADHGEEFFEHGGAYHGTTLYEEQLHVPLIIHSRDAKAGVRSKLAEQIDIAPTIVARFGVQAPDVWVGRDLLGNTQEPAYTLATEDHEGHVLSSIRTSDAKLKLIVANQDNPRGLAATELYDLTQDPTEQSPKQDAQQLKKMRGLLKSATRNAEKNAAKASNRTLDADGEAALRALGYVE